MRYQSTFFLSSKTFTTVLNDFAVSSVKIDTYTL